MTVDQDRDQDHVTAMTVEPAEVGAVIDQIVSELGGSLGVLLSGLGVRSGLWQAMAGAGPLSVGELAERTSLLEPYVREWLRAQAAGGYLTYDPVTERFTLPDAVAAAIVHGPGGAILDACTTMFASMGSNLGAFEEAFRGGRGFGWHERGPTYWHGSDQFTRVALAPELVAGVVAAMDGPPEALRDGGTVADIGCGYGAPSIMVAQGFTAATVVGFDYHDASIANARKAAAESGVSDRVRFEVAAATDFPGSGYSLITFFDSLHDLGDPVGALAHARRALAPGGAVLLCEPAGADRVQDNFNPSGRMFYAVSMLVCTANALSQPTTSGITAIGTLAGEQRLREVAEAAGFSRVRRLPADAPLNLMLELRV